MNPVAMITGASRGLGRGIALALAQLGYDLALNFASNRQAAEGTEADCQGAARSAGQKVRIGLCQADISKDLERRGLVEFAKATFGRLDLLVNNAGVAPKVRADLLETGEESFDRLMT